MARYQPENFDGRFIGPLSAREALIRSRNVPAIWLANQLKNPSLHGFLQSAGISGLRSEEHYGLSLVLGGGELSMEELVRLYGLLANEGRLAPLRFCTDEPMGKGIPLLSPQAAFMVRAMLASNPRADAMQSRKKASSHWPIAWKTGTSWGFHDAWTVGLVGEPICWRFGSATSTVKPILPLSVSRLPRPFFSRSPMPWSRPCPLLLPPPGIPLPILFRSMSAKPRESCPIAGARRR